MPCHRPCDADDDECWGYGSRETDYEIATQESRVRLGMIERYEQMLCSACTALAQLKFNFSVNPELDRWWASHQEEDRLREAEEARKRMKHQQAIELTKTKLLADMSVEEKAWLRREGLL